jgi:hypothetical protein
MNYPYPPPWGYGPPPQSNRGHNNRELNKIAKNAVREALRLKDMDKNNKRKRREERSKKAAQTRQKVFTFLEIFILGVILHPFVGALFNYLQHKVLP